MDEILKIVLNSNKERRLLSNDEVKRICKIIISMGKYDLPFDVMFMPVLPDDPKCGGICFANMICFFRHGIECLMDHGYQSLTNNFTMDGSKIDIYNFYYLVAIFHELAHLRQKYMIEHHPKKFESKLFNLCELFVQNDEFYNAHHDIFPTEVNANNLAGTRACSLYSRLPREYVSEYDISAYQMLAVQNMLHNVYEVEPFNEEIISPCEQFLKALVDDDIEITEDKFQEFHSLIYRPNKMSLYQKLMLGLPISFDEYARMDLLYRTVENGQDINLVKKLKKLQKKA